MINILSWNIRGAANPKSKRQLRQHIEECKPDFIILIEPMVNHLDRFERFLKRLAYDIAFTNQANNNQQGKHAMGNIWILRNSNSQWKEKILYTDKQFVHFQLEDEQGHTILCSGIHASTKYTIRRDLWESLSLLTLGIDLPWLVAGDFNVVTDQSHKKGGRKPLKIATREALEFLSNNNLLEISYQGPQFTWSNNRTVGYIAAKIDNGFVNDKWMDHFKLTKMAQKTRTISDHAPLDIRASSKVGIKKVFFQFEQAWIQHPDFLNQVQTSWKREIQGNPQYILLSKLKRLRMVLLKWNTEVFGNLKQNIKSLDYRMAAEQDKMDNGSIEAKAVWGQLNKELEVKLLQEEIATRQKSRIKWLKEGNKNTKFFHNTMKIRANYNSITRLQNEGEELHDQEDIERAFVNHYKVLYNSSTTTPHRDLIQIIQDEISNPLKLVLAAIPTEEEIKDTIMGMNKDSAPGPDGFSGAFFQAAWDIIQHDIVKAVRNFFLTGSLLKEWNNTSIVLLPKKQGAIRVEDFRPISLCNFIYKILSKILANKLKKVLPIIITPNQSGFVKHRSIFDAIGMAQELMHKLAQRQEKNSMAVKLDISKAFDRINWDFIHGVMEKWGFPGNFRRWVKECISSSYFQIKINGNISQSFRASQGLRQGDPLSPLLFILVEDILSRHLIKLEKENKIKPIYQGKKLPVVTHLMFADDIIIFMKTKRKHILNLKNLLQRYQNQASQPFSSEKSVFFTAGVSIRTKNYIAHNLKLKHESLPTKYLGVQIMGQSPKRGHFQELIEKVSKKLTGWKKSSLSKVGRLLLIKHVISAIPMHNFQAFLLPTSILKDIEKLMRKFLWDEGQSIAWRKISLPFAEGGLGIQKLGELNRAIQIVRGWRMISSDSIWAQYMRGKYLYNQPIWNNKRHALTGSHSWRAIRSIRRTLQNLTGWKIANGEEINLAQENWLPNSSLIIENMQNMNPSSKVSDILQNGHWTIPPHWPQNLASLILSIKVEGDHDQRIWKGNSDKASKIRNAWNIIRTRGTTLQWGKKLWTLKIPPDTKFFIWKLWSKGLQLEELWKRKGYQFPSRCHICQGEEENERHLFLDCIGAKEGWDLIRKSGMLTGYPSSLSLLDQLTWINQNNNLDRFSTHLLLSASLLNLQAIWTHRNDHKFEKAGRVQVDYNRQWLKKLQYTFIHLKKQIGPPTWFQHQCISSLS